MTDRNPVTKGRADGVQDRKLKLAEAGVAFFLIVGLCVYLGIYFAKRPLAEPVVTHDHAASRATEFAQAPQTAVTVETAAATRDGTEPVVVVRPHAATPERETPDVRDLLPGVPQLVTYTSAERTFFEGRYREAAEMFAVYCEERPENAWGHYMRGIALWKAGQAESARAAFNTALGLQPDHLKSLVNLARVELELSDPDAALRSIERALDIAPQHVEALRVLGRAYHQLGRADLAAASYLQALHLKSDDAWTLNNLALLAIEAEQFDRALAPLARAVALLPDAAVIRNNLATALERTGHLAQAREHYLLAAERGSGHAETSFARLDAVRLPAGETSVDLAALATDWALAASAEAAWHGPATVAVLAPDRRD